MSKVLFPSLRIGYVVLPQELVEPFERLRLIVDDHGPLIDQATLASFISSGAFHTHVRRCRKIYASRLSIFLESMEMHQVPLAFPFTDGGMNQLGYFLNSATDAMEASRKLYQQGLDVPPLQHFCAGKARSGLVFGFTAFDPPKIRSSIATIAKALK